MRDIEFVQQLAAKLCHELSGPISAVNHGMEVFEGESGEMLDRTIEMTRGSASAALARLMFFRSAYGIAKLESDTPLTSVKTITSNYLEDLGIGLIIESDKKDEILFNNHAIKIFLCLICLGGKVLYQRANMKASAIISADGKKKISLICFGSKISADMLKLEVLEGRKRTITDTAEAHAYYTRRMVDDIGAELKVNVESEKLEFTLTIIPV